MDVETTTLAGALTDGARFCQLPAHSKRREYLRDGRAGNCGVPLVQYRRAPDAIGAAGTARSPARVRDALSWMCGARNATDAARLRFVQAFRPAGHRVAYRVRTSCRHDPGFARGFHSRISPDVSHRSGRSGGEDAHTANHATLCDAGNADQHPDWARRQYRASWIRPAKRHGAG